MVSSVCGRLPPSLMPSVMKASRVGENTNESKIFIVMNLSWPTLEHKNRDERAWSSSFSLVLPEHRKTSLKAELHALFLTRRLSPEIFTGRIFCGGARAKSEINQRKVSLAIGANAPLW